MTLSTALWLAAAAAAAMGWCWFAWQGLRTRRQLARLPEEDADPPAGGWPRLSVVVPCRDEARHVEAAVRSLLAQDYPELEVVAVDDRSGDGTGEILDRLAREAQGLAVLHLSALPEGWLGKNHACQAGAARSGGRWLLFTDGDVVYAQGALRRAVAYAERHRLGHLVALPRLLARGMWERGFVAAFATMALAAFRPWELRRPGSGAFIGVGAFNLVRRDAWLGAGGHERLRLEVVDDVKLGALLRRSGVPQGAVDSGGLVAVRWQVGFFPSVLGLVKNAFAAMEYRWGLALRLSAAVAFLSAVPLVTALLAPAPAARALGLLALAVSAGVHGTVARRLGGGTGLEGLLLPVCGLALAAVFPLSAVATTARGGVRWRGTFYPLATLRAGCLRLGDLPPERAAGWE
ncbi:MAG TPA: glycosyltransferase family 2 protein [Anaeromyxobacteraceae bacterium]|nr:glycosyltransferase family 2 protein [Anaeromyxobacteraceae bacterium]